MNNQIVSAAKWSGITEIVAKLITPITNIVLARLLTPEAFGIVATITMIISFAEIFTDAGFQKYLIQHEFIDESDQDDSISVAFWSNLVLSIVIWLIIALFADHLATIVGNPGLGIVLLVACISIPMSSLSSIQMALYKRNLDFKTLFNVRIVSVCIPLFITIPLAIFLRSYWALIIGTIIQNLANVVLLSVYSKWRPKLFYSFDKLKEMFSFTSWSLIEAISIWLTSYIDIFIVGVYLNEYYVGLYKTSTTLVGQITGLVTSATTPILFASLSRLQTNRNEFEDLFFKFQKLVGVLIVPLGIGIFCFKDFITEVLLGQQWREASRFIGMWGLTSAITIIFSHYCSEVYRALGRPKLSVLAQWLHIVVLCPVVYFSVQYGYDCLCVSRTIVRLELVLVNLLIMYSVVHIPPKRMFVNTFPQFACAIIMAIVAAILLYINDYILLQPFYIVICMVVYFMFLLFFKDERNLLLSYIKKK